MSTRAHREGAQTGAPAYASVNVIDWPASAETCKGTRLGWLGQVLHIQDLGQRISG